mmetsp:Transcript_36102/g.70151  ORF Transcript_36102/g.70151 Transcript_36102/m.70151 type:complete len:243 (+) Transcript_36102:2780-3508(+)
MARTSARPRNGAQASAGAKAKADLQGPRNIVPEASVAVPKIAATGLRQAAISIAQEASHAATTASAATMMIEATTASAAVTTDSDAETIATIASDGGMIAMIASGAETIASAVVMTVMTAMTASAGGVEILEGAMTTAVRDPALEGAEILEEDVKKAAPAAPAAESEALGLGGVEGRASRRVRLLPLRRLPLPRLRKRIRSPLRKMTMGSPLLVAVVIAGKTAGTSGVEKRATISSDISAAC